MLRSEQMMLWNEGTISFRLQKYHQVCVCPDKGEEFLLSFCTLSDQRSSNNNKQSDDHRLVRCGATHDERRTDDDNRGHDHKVWVYGARVEMGLALSKVQ